MSRIENWHPQTDPARLLALSDGIFSVGMTLAAVQILPPDLSQRLIREGTAAVLADLWPQFVAVSVTFMIVGFYWITHHRIFSYIRRVDLGFLTLNMFLLLGVTLMPFAVQLTSLPRTDATAVVFYGAYVGTLGLLLNLIWYYATRGRRLVDADLPEEIVLYSRYRSAISSAVFYASIPLVYAVGVGPARCVWLLLFFNGRVAARLARRPGRAASELM
jgi:uncharacterized membrane protein